MVGSLRDRKAGDFMESVAARTIPTSDCGVDVDGLGKRLVAFCVVGVDDLPRRQHEHGGMERVGSEHGFQLDGWQMRSLVKHAERIDQAAIEEDPPRSGRLSEVLLDVSTQDLSGEGKSIGPTTGTARKAFCDDGPSGIIEGCVAHGGKRGQERRLARSRPAGDDDTRHRYLESAPQGMAAQLRPPAMLPRWIGAQPSL